MKRLRVKSNMQECIACKNMSKLENFPYSMASQDGFCVVCFDCIMANPIIEIHHGVCRRCHLPNASMLRPGNLGCRICINKAQIAMKRFRSGQITAAEVIISHPYSRGVQRIFEEEIFDFKYKGILSIDQEIINNIT